MQSNFTDDGETNFKTEQDGSSWSLYAQSDIALAKRLTLNAGLRFDNYSNFGGTLNPRLGLVYNPNQKTTFKLLYGQAFRAPNAYELYLESPGFNQKNLNLQPETIQTYEVVWEQYLSRSLRLSVAGYYYDTVNLITQTRNSTDGSLVFKNTSEATAQGVEIGLTGDLAHGIKARASYSLQHAEDGESGEELNNSPRHMGKVSLITPLYRDYVHAGVDLQYYSSMKTLAGGQNSGFFIANATLFSHEIVRGLELSASVYNLFDKKYSYPGSTGHVQDTIPQEGRSFWVKLQYRF